MTRLAVLASALALIVHLLTVRVPLVAGTSVPVALLVILAELAVIAGLIAWMYRQRTGFRSAPWPRNNAAAAVVVTEP